MIVQSVFLLYLVEQERHQRGSASAYARLDISQWNLYRTRSLALVVPECSVCLFALPRSRSRPQLLPFGRRVHLWINLPVSKREGYKCVIRRFEVAVCSTFDGDEKVIGNIFGHRLTDYIYVIQYCIFSKVTCECLLLDIWVARFP